MAGRDMSSTTLPKGSKILTGTYSWSIDDFFGGRNYSESPIFSLGLQNEIKIQLYLWKTEMAGKSWCLVNSRIAEVAPELPTVTIREGFSVINSKGENTCTCTKQENTTLLRRGYTAHIGVISLTETTGNPRFLILDNKFTLVYEMNLWNSTAKSETPTKEMSKLEISGRTISEDFEVLFNSQKDSDVILLVDSQEFTAHKVILSSRSSVFATMFTTQMKEAQENRVKIEDIDAGTFKELLRFIYTDEVLNLHKNAYELLRAAHKYDLSRLQSVCEIHLCRNLDTENCATILCAADTYNCNELKKQALRFMVDHATIVTKTKSFEVMVRSHPHLMMEAFQAFGESSSK